MDFTTDNFQVIIVNKTLVYYWLTEHFSTTEVLMRNTISSINVLFNNDRFKETYRIIYGTEHNE